MQFVKIYLAIDADEYFLHIFVIAYTGFNKVQTTVGFVKYIVVPWKRLLRNVI